MLDFIRGKLLRRSPMELVLDVGGIGFRIIVPMSTSMAVGAIGAESQSKTVELLTHVQITSTDPQIRLFGFYTESERRMFELLTSVKGVGPGMAIRVLSGASVEELQEAIIMQDAGRLTRVKGIGKKTAERILFDLKEKVLVFGDASSDLPLSVPDSGRAEAMGAMTALGYDGREARKAVEAALNKLGHEASSENLVRQALQEIS
jgi:holliday junction DNA helicase RuvA